MPFVALGVEHKTAPLAIREQAVMDGADIKRISTLLGEKSSIAEVAILSTCNRTEMYLYADDAQSAIDEARAHLPTADCIQIWHEMEVADHLFRVASGLESQVLGEAQILSQVRDALELAQQHRSLGPNLHTMFRSAISCARQARAATALGRVDTSLGTEAVRAARKALGSLEGATVLLIGSGEICRVVAHDLRDDRLRTLYVTNRTLTVAQELAEETGGKAVPLSSLPSLIPHVDVIFSATSAPHYVLTAEDVSPRSRPLHVFDLAVPRDVDPSLALRPDAHVYDLDTLLPAGIDGHWDRDIEHMESAIAAEVQEFMAWYLTRRVVPVISNLRTHVEAVHQQELKRVASQLAGLSPRERAAVESMTSRLIDKMFHHLVLRLRMAAQTDPALVKAAEFFFLHGEGALFDHAAHQPHESKQPEMER